MGGYFEKLCAAAGVVPLNGEALDEADQAELLNCMEQFTSYAKLHASTRKPGHVIEIGFFDADEINAFATTWEGVDAIAISWGVVKTLRGLFGDILTPPGFAWIDSPKRKAASVWFYECAKHFIFLHELGHIWNGHTSFLLQNGIPFIEELRAFPNGKIGNIDRQTMELDADGVAAANIFRLAVVSNRFPAINAPFEQQQGIGATHLAMASLAIHLVFRLFDAAADFDHDAKYAHPTPPLRQRIIAGILAAQAAKTGVFEEENAWNIILSGMMSAEDAYAKWAGRPRDDQEFRAAFGPEGDKYITKLLRHWHILRPQLDVLKRGGVLPPIQEIPDENE